MGKLPYIYTDSEETEDTSSSVDTSKKKKKFSILKYTKVNLKKKKCIVHRYHSDPDECEFQSRSSVRIKKLRGILKHHRDKESSDEDEDLDLPLPRPMDRCLVGRVPRPVGSRPGRGGGLALVVRKNTGLQGLQSLQAQCSYSSTKRRRSMMKRLMKKQSY